MSEKGLRVNQYFAGILFVNTFIRMLSLMLSSSDKTLFMVLQTAGMLFFAVALFIEKFSLIEIGAVFQIVSLFDGAIRNLSYTNTWVLINLAGIVGYVFIVVAIIRKREAMKYCLIGSAFFLIKQIIFVVPLLQNFENVEKILQLNSQIKNAIDVSMPFILMGGVLESRTKGIAEKMEDNKVQIDPVDGKIEALGKLKKLLDDKIITQEEFDAKKKQILGI